MAFVGRTPAAPPGRRPLVRRVPARRQRRVQAVLDHPRPRDQRQPAALVVRVRLDLELQAPRADRERRAARHEAPSCRTPNPTPRARKSSCDSKLYTSESASSSKAATSSPSPVPARSRPATTPAQPASRSRSHFSGCSKSKRSYACRLSLVSRSRSTHGSGTATCSPGWSDRSTSARRRRPGSPAIMLKSSSSLRNTRPHRIVGPRLPQNPLQHRIDRLHGAPEIPRTAAADRSRRGNGSTYGQSTTRPPRRTASCSSESVIRALFSPPPLPVALLVDEQLQLLGVRRAADGEAAPLRCRPCCRSGPRSGVSSP